MWMWMFNCCKWLKKIQFTVGSPSCHTWDSRLGVAGLGVWGAFSARPHCKCRDCIEVWGRTDLFFLPSQIFKHLVVRIFVWIWSIFVDVWMFFFTLWEGWENIGWFWSSKEFQMGGLGLASVASVFGSFGEFCFESFKALKDFFGDNGNTKTVWLWLVVFFLWLSQKVLTQKPGLFRKIWGPSNPQAQGATKTRRCAGSEKRRWCPVPVLTREMMQKIYIYYRMI